MLGVMVCMVVITMEFSGGNTFDLLIGDRVGSSRSNSKLRRAWIRDKIMI